MRPSKKKKKELLSLSIQKYQEKSNGKWREGKKNI